ncbi:hypothetical protein VTI74DRAFT_4221 [Chaetomium olivicolor]
MIGKQSQTKSFPKLMRLSELSSCIYHPFRAARTGSCSDLEQELEWKATLRLHSSKYPSSVEGLCRRTSLP